MSPASLSGSGSLYIGDLHPDVTEAILFEIFKDLGPVISIRVCRDTITRASLGYAYVNFQNPIDAERAIDTQNHILVKERPIRIMWSQRDPSARRSGLGNVFIKNLHKDIDNKALYDTFSGYGNILSCKVVYDENGHSKGYGFVHFESEDASKKAVEEMNNMMLQDTKIFVGPFVKRSQRQSGILTRFTNVYIKEIQDLDATELKEKFSKFGEVTSACTRKEPRLARTFGFVNFANHEMAVKAIEEYHGQEVEGLSVEGSKLYVQRAMKRAERDIEIRKRFLAEKAKRQFPPANNLYVKNLDESVNDEELRKLFNAFGEVTSSVIMKDFNTKQSKGFGFVCYKEAEQAQKALLEMNGKMFGTKPLYVNIAQKKDARRSMLELQYAQRRSMPPHAFMPPGGPGGFYNPMYYPMASYYGGKGMSFRGGKGRGAMRGGWRPGRGGQRGGMQSRQQQQQPQTIHQKEDSAALTAEALAAMSPQDQKNALGEQLYHKIHTTHPDQSAKITGMLLEMDVSETLNLLESPDVLQAKISEALLVLRAHESNQKDE